MPQIKLHNLKFVNAEEARKVCLDRIVWHLILSVYSARDLVRRYIVLSYKMRINRFKTMNYIHLYAHRIYFELVYLLY